MASWSDFAAAAPALAERVQAALDAHKHKTIATLRKDGSPRISGTETTWRDGSLDRLDHLVVDVWTAAGGLKQIKRA